MCHFLPGSTNVLVNLESALCVHLCLCMCACTCELLCLAAREEEEHSAVCVLRESCGKVLLKAALIWGNLCDGLCQCPVSVCVFLLLPDMCLELILLEPVKGKAAATAPSLGRPQSRQEHSRSGAAKEGGSHIPYFT